MMDMASPGESVAKPVESYSVTVTTLPLPVESDAQVTVQGPAKRPADAIADIYKLYVGTVESNIDRRLKLNQYYYSIVAAIVVAYAYLAEGRLKPPSDLKHLVGDVATISAGTASPMLWLLPLLLLFISIAWLVQLRAMGRISTMKFSTIYAMEERLPACPFTEEAKRREEMNIWISGSRVEMFVPLALALIALVALALAMPLSQFIVARP